MPNGWIRWLNTAVGRDGAPVPTPPEWRESFTTSALGFGRAALAVAGAIAGVGVLSLANVLLQGELVFGSAEFYRRIALASAIALGGGVLAIAVSLLIAFAFWPISRKSLGRALEDAAAELSADELVAEIRRCEIGRAEAPEKHRWRYDARLDWLRTRLRERSGR